jgi:hypothetical protein
MSCSKFQAPELADVPLDHDPDVSHLQQAMAQHNDVVVPRSAVSNEVSVTSLRDIHTVVLDAGMVAPRLAGYKLGVAITHGDFRHKVARIRDLNAGHPLAVRNAAYRGLGRELTRACTEYGGNELRLMPRESPSFGAWCDNIALYFALRLVVYGEPAPVMFMDTDGDNVVDLQGFYTGGPL